MTHHFDQYSRTRIHELFQAHLDGDKNAEGDLGLEFDGLTLLQASKLFANEDCGDLP